MLRKVQSHFANYFNEDKLFDVSIIKGAELGTLYSDYEGYEADEFYLIPQENLFFIAETNVTIDEILIKASTEIPDAEWGGNNANYPKRSNRKGKDIIQPIGGATGGETLYGIGKISGGMEILLGETKYFGLKKKYEDGEEKYEIAVTDTTYGEMPTWPTLSDGWSWVKNSNVWGTNPIEKLGTKSGVYWEKKWFDKTDNKNKNIPNGMIRLIGRYWESGKENDFKVKLKATDKADIVVKVVEPGKLLTEGESPSYSKTRDVFDKVVNIDSLCIYYGGLNGIPPQFLKGHIAQESAKKNFGGTVGWGFAPSYRYEPYTVQIWRRLHENYRDNPFYITASTNVEPPEHQHVEIIPYFSGDTVTVWQIVKEHSQLVEDGSTPETRMYGTRTHVDTMNYAGYPTIKRKYHGFLEDLNDTKISSDNGEKRLMTFAEKADSANKQMIIYLRDEFTDGIGTIGMKNMIAQTRVASSYGYFQPIYTTAILPTWGYEENEEHPPENLNRNDVVFPLSVNRYNSFLSSYLENEEDNNWSLGFETAVKDHILGNWNTHKAYPNSTINNMERFLPQK